MAVMKFEINDEMISSMIHIIGVMFSIIAIAFLVVYSSVMKDPWKIVSFSVYGLTLLFLFLFSSLYHGINKSKAAKERLRTFDYMGIFLLVAGTFTPVCLTVLRGVFGWTLFGIVWFFAFLGLVLRGGFRSLPIWVTSPVFIIMGWLGLLVAWPIYNLSPMALELLVLGALFYTFGFIIFSMQKPIIIEGKFTFHEIWHILVLLGAISHFLMMFFYILPA